MKLKLVYLALISLMLPIGLYAQRVEVSPYAGGFWPMKNDTLGKFKSEGLYGIKAGGFVGSKFEIGANLGYMNHFNPSNDIATANAIAGVSNQSIRSLIWEGTADYNFNTHNFMGRAVTPYVSGSLGGMTAFIANDGGSAVFTGGTRIHDGAPVARNTLVLDNKDSFLTFSYGGGVKALQLWGPVGLRADVRGRTLPNFFGRGLTWAEATGGLTFSWGER